MQRSLEAFGSKNDDLDFSVHHAGVAVEHALKAYLAAQHPALIVEAANFDSLLHAVGLGTYAKVPLSRVKTISVTEAFARTRVLLRPKLVIDDKQMAAIAAARNGVAHLGLHERPEAEDVLATCFRVVDVLMDAMGESPSAYWGHYISLHDQMIKADADRQRSRLEAKLVTARKLYATRFEQMDSSAWSAVREALEAVELYPTRDAERATCPACGQQGWLAGRKEIEVEYDSDHDGSFQGGALVVMVGDTFGCAFCKLELNKPELALTDIEYVFETDDDVNDFLDNYEPDEDYMRDR
jgi:hypothetical protein